MLEVIQIIFNNIVVTSILTVVLIYLVYFVLLIRSYPRGPLILPLLGNVLLFRGNFNDRSVTHKLKEWAEKYGPIYTLWAGHRPIIIVNSYELNVETSVTKKDHFIERADLTLRNILKIYYYHYYSRIAMKNIELLTNKN